MFNRIRWISLVAGLAVAASAVAQAPAPAVAPAGSTGMCRDGSYWSGATKKGACHGHKGVQDWYGGAERAAANPAPAVALPPGTTTVATPAAAAATVAPAAASQGSLPVATQAPGGGNGQVWVNSSSNVYHCAGDRWYGKTKSGVYMSEADAVAKGNRPDHGKACK